MELHICTSEKSQVPLFRSRILRDQHPASKSNSLSVKVKIIRGRSAILSIRVCLEGISGSAMYYTAYCSLLP
jgi:hypothetical protein